MPTEKNLLSTGYSDLTDGSGEYVTVSDASPTQSLVTPNSGLISKDRHIVACSSGCSGYHAHPQSLSGTLRLRAPGWVRG
jgi:hypothetical protein